MINRWTLAGLVGSLVFGHWGGAPEAPNLAFGRPYTLVPETNYDYGTDDGDAAQWPDGERVSDQQFLDSGGLRRLEAAAGWGGGDDHRPGR